MSNTEFPKLRTPFRIVRIDNGPANPPTGIESYHRTAAAAQKEIDRRNQALRKEPAHRSAWHPLRIERFDGIAWVHSYKGEQLS